MRTRFAHSTKACSGPVGAHRIQPREVAPVTQKDLVVSADGHMLEPVDLFRTRLPKHLRDRGVWEEDFEIEPLVDGGARIFRRLHTPGYRGLDHLPVPPDGRADARRRSGDHPGRHGTRRGRHPGDAPEPVAVRALLGRSRALDGTRPCVQRLHHRAVQAVLLADRPHRPDPVDRHRRCRRRDRAGRRRPGSVPSSSRRSRRSRTTPGTSTRSGRRRSPTACTCSSIPRPVA